jgi:hypothetical protein
VRALWYRFVRSPLEGHGWPIIAAFAVVALALGTWGFAVHPQTESGSFFDHLYYAIQLFTFQPKTDPPPIQLELARWIAPSVSIAATVGALLAIFRDQVAWLRVRFARNHLVICGLGRCGMRLAVGFRDEGHRVVVLEKDAAAPRLTAMRRSGIIVLPADATEPTILRRAGIARARYLIAVCGDDAINVDVTADAHELMDPDRRRPLDCFAHVVDQQVRQFLNEWSIRTPKAQVFRLNAFDVSELGAPAILVEHPPFDRNGWTTFGRPHLVVVGLGQTGSRLLLGAAQLWATTRPGSDGTLRVTVIDRWAHDLTVALRARHPRLDTLLELTPLTADVDSPAFPREATAVDDGTNVYICLDEELRGLRTALTLRRTLRNPAAPITVRTTERSSLSTFPTGLESSQVNVQIVHMLDRACTPEVLLRGTNEVIAEAIHAEYIRSETERGNTAETNPSMVPWSALPDDLKESNRHQAAHIGSKLREIACDIVSLEDLDQPSSVEFLPEEVERLARLEHERWWKDRKAAGWTFAPTKNVERKESPYLVPYEDLSEDIRDHDRNTVRALPAFLAKAGFAIVRLQGGTGPEHARDSGGAMPARPSASG